MTRSWNSRRLGLQFLGYFRAIRRGINPCRHLAMRDRRFGRRCRHFFSGTAFGSGWTADDLQEAESGEISALTLDDNVAQVSVLPGSSPGEPVIIEPVQPDTGLVFSNETTTITNGGVPPQIETYRPVDGKNWFMFSANYQPAPTESFWIYPNRYPQNRLRRNRKMQWPVTESQLMARHGR